MANLQQLDLLMQGVTATRTQHGPLLCCSSATSALHHANPAGDEKKAKRQWRQPCKKRNVPL
jgi:hypothetical protein